MTYYSGGKNADGLGETPHITGKVHFEIRCAVCHTGLCKRMTILKSPRRKQNIILVEPCPTCLEAARTGTEPKVLTINSEYQESLE